MANYYTRWKITSLLPIFFIKLALELSSCSGRSITLDLRMELYDSLWWDGVGIDYGCMYQLSEPCCEPDLGQI